MRLSWVLTVLSICLSALVTAAGAEGKRKLQIGVKKRVDHCPIKSRKGDVLHMHYTGKLEDGTEFDSSLPQNQPFVFSLGTGQVIKGWDQGLLGMCEGEKRKLVIPSELGYGERGAPPKIPGNKPSCPPSPAPIPSPCGPGSHSDPTSPLQEVQPWCSRWSCSKSSDVQNCSQTGEGWWRGPHQGPDCLKKEKNFKAHEVRLCLSVGPGDLRNHSFSLPSPSSSPHPSLSFPGCRALGSSRFSGMEVMMAKPWVTWWPLSRGKKE
uniref:peptidylprolyl isomerase n=1 Tax=Balaenoptera musculus TaxID=9771 RepID=A0A8C0D304_BALMU